MDDILYRKTIRSIPHTDAELCVNLWYFTDSTGVVLRIAAKAYALTGTDEEKLAALRMLSGSDHLTARQGKIPSRFKLSIEGGTFSGAVPVTVLQEHPMPYFDDLVGEIVADLPQVIHAIEDEPHAFRMELVEPFLFISTCVYEEQDGTLVARLS